MKWNKTKCTFAARLIYKHMMELSEVPPINKEAVKKRYKEMFGYELYDEAEESTPEDEITA